MALDKITYTDKETLNEQPSIADKNKVTDDDMNEIKRVVNAGIDQIDTNTTNIGNITGTILWTNPNPNQSMDATNISLSSSDYDVLEIFYKHFYSDNYILSQRTIKGAGTILLTNVAGSLARRQITQPDATTLSITAGDNTAAMVPVYVIGYKTGLFS